ncbi:MAG TPA: hypothetical protein VMG98_07810 [Verrucomicrobiae bacterium]|nr:hypothetical protein [Verrucomicrobiae bacterium]
MFLAFPFLALGAIGVACAALGCIVPLPAIAAAAALNLSRRSALIVAGVVWLADQSIGFTLKAYPHDSVTVAWGLALGLGTVAAYVVARVVSSNPLLAFLGSFVAFEAVLVLFSFVLGGWDAYAPRWLFEVFAINAAWFVGAHATLRLVSRRPIFGAATR